VHYLEPHAPATIAGAKPRNHEATMSGCHTAIAAAAGLLFAACTDLPSAPTAETPFASVAASPAARAPVSIVTGGGTFEVPGVPGFSAAMSVHMTVSIARFADGAVRGTVVNRADLTQFGLGYPTFSMDVDCLVVSGNTAWFSGVTRQSTGAFPAVGDAGIGVIVDLGSTDLAFSGPVDFWAPGQTCVDMPSLPQLPVSAGSFHVR
jgi:hypothetical protein